MGIDIAERMIVRARERAKEWNLEAAMRFCVADAYCLPVESGTFDMVLTEFTSIFLEKERVFQECVRVLKKGGFVRVNEPYKSENIPQEARKLIEEGENLFRQAVGLPIVLPSPSKWEAWFVKAGLRDVRMEEVGGTYTWRQYAEVAGGGGRLAKLILRSIYHLLFNKRFRGKLMKVKKLGRVLMRNKMTKPYVGALLCRGQK